MPHNEEGEFELVLGNRQLLSVFFIVVVLLGVFFVMGYILGKNSGPTAPATEIASAKKPSETGPPPSPIIVDKTSTKPSAASEETNERKVEKEAPKKTEPTPEPVKEEPKPEKKAKKEEPKPEPKKEVAKSSGDVKTGTPPKGSQFMQVAAVGRAEADVVAKVLRGKGFPIWIAPTEKENIYRVLVGPIEASEKGKYKTQLVDLGFSPFPRAYN